MTEREVADVLRPRSGHVLASPRRPPVAAKGSRPLTPGAGAAPFNNTAPAGMQPAGATTHKE